MKAGKLRHRIDICSVTEENSSNVYGEPIQSESTYKCSAWASVNPIQMDEKFIGVQIAPQATHKIQLRGDIPVEVTDVIKFGARVFRIEAIIDVEERGIVKDLLCKEEI